MFGEGLGWGYLKAMPFHLYLLRRILLVIPIILGITLMAFIVANTIPADPVTANLPQNALNNEEMVRAFEQKWGLDKPLPEQYLTYLQNLLRGDLGTSIKTRKPILEDVKAFLPATIELATLAVIVAVVLGISSGVISSVWRNSVLDYATRTVSLLGVSFPVYILALILLRVFHGELGWAAGPGRLDFLVDPPPEVTGLYLIDSLLAGQWSTFRNALSHLVLPAIALASFTTGIISRVTRTAMLKVLDEDYVRTARAKGLRAFIVVIRHALPNALIPVVTVIGLSYANLLAGTILIESIFAYPGIGRYMFRASTSQDFPAIMSVSLIFALIYIGVNFIVDILYYFIDPRIRQN